MPQMLLFCDLDLQFQGHWWPLKGQILAIFNLLAISRKLLAWVGVVLGINNFSSLFSSETTTPIF